MSPEAAEAIFPALNAVVLPWWAVFLVAPRSRWAARLASHTAIFLVLGAVYTALLIAALSTPSDASSAQGFAFWSGLLASPNGFLAGWTHYLAFDLFVGAWIVREGQRLAWSPRVSLLFTLLAGPLGLGLFLVRRAVRLRTLGQLGDSDLA